MCSTLVASKHPSFAGEIHVNTGIGVRETREYVRDTCEVFGWPLHELHPPDLTYVQMVEQYGFPGPGSHLYAYSWLKERALRAFVASVKRDFKDRIGLVTGVRWAESKRRMGTVEPIQRNGAQVWMAPIAGWAATDRLAYMAANGAKPNPVVLNLHMSGECLCGAFAEPGELDFLAAWYPETAAEIRAIERQMAEKGLPAKWGCRPPSKVPEGQQDMFSLFSMCVSCPNRGGEETA
jgi:3'-phosphoadenosine 5'-phosphosulfate sulfotransferase (PAPS reductase)/FAD synthetase